MITIKISSDYYKHSKYSLSVKGHAEQAEHGQDIVCSAASILTYTAAQIVKEMEAIGWCLGSPKVEMKSGDADIEVTFSMFHEEEASNMLHVIKTGYELPAHNYPQYVRLIES
jgi:uncharacterized protein YsxB (DUF464 family)